METLLNLCKHSHHYDCGPKIKGEMCNLITAYDRYTLNVLNLMHSFSPFAYDIKAESLFVGKKSVY